MTTVYAALNRTLKPTQNSTNAGWKRARLNVCLPAPSGHVSARTMGAVIVSPYIRDYPTNGDDLSVLPQSILNFSLPVPVSCSSNVQNVWLWPSLTFPTFLTYPATHLQTRPHASSKNNSGAGRSEFLSPYTRDIPYHLAVRPRRWFKG